MVNYNWILFSIVTKLGYIKKIPFLLILLYLISKSLISYFSIFFTKSIPYKCKLDFTINPIVLHKLLLLKLTSTI